MKLGIYYNPETLEMVEVTGYYPNWYYSVSTIRDDGASFFRRRWDFNRIYKFLGEV